MAEDVIRVTRIYVFEGLRRDVEDQVSRSLGDGTRILPNKMKIHVATIGSVPERVPPGGNSLAAFPSAATTDAAGTGTHPDLDATANAELDWLQAGYRGLPPPAPRPIEEPYDASHTGQILANSAQPCGCDPGANWVCAQHRAEELSAIMPTPDPDHEG